MFSIADYSPPTYNKGAYKFPPWGIAMGWAIAGTSLIAIPLYACIAVAKAKGNICQVKKRNYAPAPNGLACLTVLDLSYV